MFLAAPLAARLTARATADFPSRRPAPADRKFTSPAVEAKIAEVRGAIRDPEMAWLFENCFPNTLDTTVRTGELDGKPDTFVITGDIDAMWLRDSTAQVWPYVPLARQDPKLKTLLAGVIHRQTRSILIDPYANAFNFGPTGSEWGKDLTTMRPELHERKWEIDSLCFPVRLAHAYWKATGDASVFDERWREASALIVETFREQQRMKDRGPYKFQRITAVPSDSLPGEGYGNPTRPCGMIHSGFRPSDDACMFPFLIPSNLFAVRALEQMAEIHSQALRGAALASDCRTLSGEVRRGLDAWGKVRHPRFGTIWAYEADGFGNQLFMDDANVPSLLSMPYYGACSGDDPVYRNTRAFVLSGANPYYYRGSTGEGLGGPHSGLNMIWPLGIVIRGITSRNQTEIADCLKMLKATHAGTGFMHESFDKDDASKFTRKWFAWANTMFGEFVLKVLETHPALLKG
jgi:uncharacterized protein